VSLRQERDNPELYELAQEVALRDGDAAEKVAEDRISQEAMAHRDKIMVGAEIEQCVEQHSLSK
jgi:hypothetical protein